MTDGDDPAGTALLQRAHDAASRGEWSVAFELFIEADAAGLVGLADLPVFGTVAYGAGQLDRTIETWERAYAGCSEAGETIGAALAAVRVAMHLLFDTALMAPVRGWLARAEALLEGQPETPVHAWFAVVRSYERLLAGDLETSRVWAQRAVEVGLNCDPAACAIGRVAEARNLILDGDVERGLALLDEAGVAAVSGGLDPLSTGVVYCELVCTLQGLAQYDLAEEWTEAMERWSRTNAIGSLQGRCRVHRAEILRLRGQCDEAEDEAIRAWEELRPYLKRELGWPLAELGRIRLRKGDIDGAEQALVAAHNAGWDAQPGLALVRLAQGDVAGAAASVRDALEHPSSVPSKELPPNTDLRRAPLLDAQVEIAIAAGDVERARDAAVELTAIARRYRSNALGAAATLAEGRVRLAEGDHDAAAECFADAAKRWGDVGAPYEAAVARLRLADAHHGRGAHERAALDEHAARAILDRIEMTPEPDRPMRAERQLAPRQSGDRAMFRREGDYWSVAFDRRTVQIRDRKGMHYLALLLAEPSREFHVLDMVAADRGAGNAPLVDLGDAGELLDTRAKEAYRRRLAEIDDDIEQARAAGDEARETQADAERDFLIRELSRAVGLSGRGRRAGSASERARVAVTRALRQAMERIAEHHPKLGEHLDHAIRTGTYCAYMPDPRAPVAWTD